ncbi:MAG: hypothetical protein K8T90_02040 [Planctomycetes bacterium]|nr:hypothetical protein [Planctomycetota bacterium]
MTSSIPTPANRDVVVRVSAATALAAGLVLGFSLLASPVPDARADDAAAGETAEQVPACLTQALAEMKRTGAPGIAIVVPAERKDRSALRDSVAALLAEPCYEVQELLVEAVWVCAPAKQVGAKPGETAVLLDAEGRRVAGAVIDFSSQVKFVEGIGPLLHGEKRLEERAKAVRTKEVKADLEKLLGKDDDARSAAAARLTEAFPTVRAAVIQARIDATDDDAAKRLRQIVSLAWYRVTVAAADRPMSALPFGASWSYAPREARADPCPPCGMARVTETTRVVLVLLTKEETKAK